MVRRGGTGKPPRDKRRMDEKEATMSNPKIRAAQDIQKFGRMLQSFIDLADELGDVGSLEQAAADAQAHLDNLNQQIEEKDAQFAKLLSDKQAEYNGLKEAQEADLSDRKRDAEKIAKNASADAEKVLSIAHYQAIQIVQEAQAKAQQLQAMAYEHNAVVDAAKVEHASIKRDIEDARRERERITKLIADLKARF